MGRKKSDKRKSEEYRGIIDMEHPERYRPWLPAREVTSGRGKRHIIPDLYYPERMIHLMSNLERDVYYTLRKNPQVIELFEQVPLESDQTIRICEEMNMEHPRSPFGEDLIVMTTDFVVYVDLNGKREFRAYAVKMEKDLKLNDI